MNHQLVATADSEGKAKFNSGGMLALAQQIDPMNLAKGLAEMMHLDSENQGLVIIMACAVENVDYITFMKKNHIIKGRPSMKAHVQLAMLNQAGWKHKRIEKTEKRAAIKLISQDGDEYDFEFTWEEAAASRAPWKKPSAKKDQDNLKDNWSTPFDRRKMLWARLITDAVATVDPAVSMGLPAPEELEDEYGPVGAVVADSQDEMPNQAAQFLDESEELDAEFEVKEGPPEEPEQDAPEPEPESSEPVDPDQTLPGKCTKAQRQKLAKVVEECIQHEIITQADMDGALKDRGVTQVNQLEKDQIEEMISNLRGLLEAGK